MRLPEGARAHRFAAPLIIAVTFVVYIPALGGGFVWDDDDHFVNDHLVTAPDGWWRIWLDPQPGVVGQPGGASVWNYWPISRVSFWLERQLWGLNPLGYHVVNVALHALNALALLSILRLLGVPGAWLAALVFAVHPVTVESAAWATQRKTLLSTLFYLLALAAYLRYEHGRGTRWHVAACALFLCALLSKTATVMLPVTLVLARWYLGRRWTRGDVLRLVPFFALSAIMAAVSIIYERYFIGSSGQEWTASFAQRAARAGMIAWFYLGKTLLPHGVSFNYPRWPVDASSIVSYLPSAGVIAVGLVLWWKRQSWGRPLALGLGYFLLNLFPVLGFFNIYGMRYAHVADHWQYLACPGVIALAVGLLAAVLDRLTRRWPVDRVRTVRYALGTGCLAVLVWFSILTWKQAQAYRDLETLWRRTLQREPRSWLAHNNLASILMERQDWEGALHHLTRATEVEPTFSQAYVNLGNVVISLHDDWEAARQYWRTATEVDPYNAQAHYNLGLVLERDGKLPEAIEHWRSAAELRPDYALALQALGNGLISTGQSSQAMPYLEQALRVRPDLVNSRRSLANVRIGNREFRAAATVLKEGLVRTPNHAAMANQLAWLLATCPEPGARDGAEALRLASQVCQTTGYKDPDGLDTLAAALATLGRFDDAARTARSAIERATAVGRWELAKRISQRLALYEQGQAYHEP